METKYIINNLNGTLPQQVIYGSLSATTISGFGSINYKNFMAHYNVEEDILTTFYNDLGDVTFTYDSVSNQVVLSATTFVVNKTFVSLTPACQNCGSNWSVLYSPDYVDVNGIGITDGDPTPGGMINCSAKFTIEIRVCN